MKNRKFHFVRSKSIFNSIEKKEKKLGINIRFQKMVFRWEEDSSLLLIERESCFFFKNNNKPEKLALKRKTDITNRLFRHEPIRIRLDSFQFFIK